MGVSQNQGHHYGGPYNKDFSILGSIFRVPLFGGNYQIGVPFRWSSEMHSEQLCGRRSACVTTLGFKLHGGLPCLQCVRVHAKAQHHSPLLSR